MISRRLALVGSAGVVSSLVVAALIASPASVASAPSPHVTASPPVAPVTRTVTLQLPKVYTPKGTNGGTDDYRCFLMPAPAGVTTNQIITGVNVAPGNKKIVHHAILYLIPPASVAQATKQNGKDGRQGWSCFGDVGLPIGNLFNYQQNAPWLAAWAPGVPAQTFPKGTGMQWPVGSRIVLQMHYNLLAGKGTDRSKVVLKVQDDDASLTPLHTMLLLAPVELACPKGVKGKLCNRAASVKEMVKRSNQQAAELANGLDWLCYNNKIVNRLTSKCSWAAQSAMTIWAVAGHMHLLGKSISVVVAPGTADQKRILNIPLWNFDDQRARKLATPLTVTAGTKLQITCTHNPKLRQMLPELRKLPPRWVTWGDGSSDEMCLSMVLYSDPPVPNAG